MIIQALTAAVLVAATALSYREDWTSIIIWVIYGQAIMLALSNFNTYSPSDSKNWVGLNTLSTVFSVIFCICSAFLGNLIIDGYW